MMDAESNYWIGLEQLHILTNQAQYTVRMDIMDWDGTMKFAEYNYFKVRFCRYYSEVSWYHGLGRNYEVCRVQLLQGKVL